MAKIKYVARLDGEIVGTRSSERSYSHAIVVQGHGKGPHAAAWCGRHDLARTAQASWQRNGWTATIVPAERLEPKAKPAAKVEAIAAPAERAAPASAEVGGVKFALAPHDAQLVRKIIERAWSIDWLRRSYESRMDLHMDLAATHLNGNPLRLKDLLEADEFNFCHDMSGICNCLDRDTGKLTRGFSPRFSQRDAA